MTAGARRPSTSAAKRALNRRDFDARRATSGQALGLHPESAEALTLTAVLYESRGQEHAAYHAYRTALEADPHYGPARDNLRRYCDQHGLDFRNQAINPAAALTACRWRNDSRLASWASLSAAGGPGDPPHPAADLPTGGLSMALATFALGIGPVRPVLRPGRRLRPALTRSADRGREETMLYLTAILTVAALIYLGYAMIRPERF